MRGLKVRTGRGMVALTAEEARALKARLAGSESARSAGETLVVSANAGETSDSLCGHLGDSQLVALGDGKVKLVVKSDLEETGLSFAIQVEIAASNGFSAHKLFKGLIYTKHYFLDIYLFKTPGGKSVDLEAEFDPGRNTVVDASIFAVQPLANGQICKGKFAPTPIFVP